MNYYRILNNRCQEEFCSALISLSYIRNDAARHKS